MVIKLHTVLYINLKLSFIRVMYNNILSSYLYHHSVHIPTK